MREAGLSIQVFDKASDIGGTWAWNHYPGAASDSECYYYCTTFSKEILQEWKWSVRYPGWEENQRYMHFVADKCEMWPYIQLKTEIVSADFQEDCGFWLIKTAADEEYTCKYFVSAMGMISEPVIVQVLESNNAVEKYREIMGATNPDNAAEGTIRKLFALNVQENSVHGSDSVENAKIEIDFFFKPEEVVG